MSNKTPAHALAKVGDIFVAQWGATMALVEFFRVTKVYPSGALVDVEELKEDVEAGGFLAGTTKPVLEPVANQDTRLTHRVTVRKDDADHVYLLMRHSRGRARPYDPQRRYHFDHCD